MTHTSHASDLHVTSEAGLRLFSPLLAQTKLNGQIKECQLRTISYGDDIIPIEQQIPHIDANHVTFKISDSEEPETYGDNDVYQFWYGLLAEQIEGITASPHYFVSTPGRVVTLAFITLEDVGTCKPEAGDRFVFGVGVNFNVPLINVRALLGGFISGVKNGSDNRTSELSVVGSIAQLETAKKDGTTENCPYIFGDRRCGVSLLYERCVVQAVNGGTSLTISAIVGSFTYEATPSRYVSGFVQVQSGQHTGASTDMINFALLGGGNASITLSETFGDVMQVGTIIDITIGCVKTMAACVENGNILRYRGFPYVPGTRTYTAGSEIGDV